MPRANPARSDYCASRHLLRNLNDAAELRRNPLVRPYFTGCADAADAVDRIRGLVYATLPRCRERKGARAHGTLARMHAALLRCDIDKQPLSVVGAELGLSDRQVRRERRVAHDAFIAALREAGAERTPACVRDTARFRLARASELHELGQSALALAACDALAAHAPPAERIEAVCLASEIERDGGRAAAANACVERAGALLARYAAELTAPQRTLAEERIDYASWCLRRDAGTVCALSIEPPAIVQHLAASGPGDELRLALLVRALAAYADQRWEVGDGVRGRAAVRRAWNACTLLGSGHAKETLAVMMADARIVGLSMRDDLAAFQAAERVAQASGHVRTLAVARAERIGTDIRLGADDDAFAGALDGLDVSERSAPWTLGAVAIIAMQVERDVRRRFELADLAARVLPPRSGLRLLARAGRAHVALDAGRYEVARILSHHLRNEAETCGNARVRGAAEQFLAAIAVAQHRRRDAVHHLDVAVPVLQRYGTTLSRGHALALARQLERAVPRTFLSANITARMTA